MILTLVFLFIVGCIFIERDCMVIRFTYFLVSLILLSACTVSPSLTDEEVISQKVRQRWVALANKNWLEAYQYETKGYRDTHTVTQFRSAFGGAATSKVVNIESVIIDKPKEKAVVKIILPIEIRLPWNELQKSNIHMTEIWLHDFSSWSHYTK